MHGSNASKYYHDNGFYQSKSILDEVRMETIRLSIEDVLNGYYETGVAPKDTATSNFNEKDTIRDINNVHLSSFAIRDLIYDSKLIKVLASIFQPEAMQVWATQLFVKPPGPSRKCNIGWHQDFFFHRNMFEPESEIFTVWIAISDVKRDCGPVLMIPGSHKWGYYDIPSSPKEYLQNRLADKQKTKWHEYPVILSPGAFSVHHPLLFHGSYSNFSDEPRISIAIRLRTNRSRLNPNIKIDLKDCQTYPIVFGDEKSLTKDI